MSPAPQQLHGFYHPFSLAVPLALASILALTHGRILLAGVATGAVTLLHISFGTRLFLLLLFGMLCWNAFGMRLAESGKRLSLRVLLLFSLTWFSAFLIIFMELRAAEAILSHWPSPRDAVLFLDPLDTLFKTDPGGFLASYIFMHPHSSGLYALLIPVLLSLMMLLLVFGKTAGRQRIVVVMLLLGLIYAFAAALLGVLLERHLLDLLPPLLQQALITSRYWDYLWVIAAIFSACGFMVGQWIILRLAGAGRFGYGLFFTLAFLLFWSAQVAKNHKRHPEAPLRLYAMHQSALKDFSYIDAYHQVCSNDVSTIVPPWRSRWG